MKKSTTLAKTSENELSNALQECLIELEGFDKYIEGILEEANLIDESFGVVTELFKQISDDIANTISDKDSDEEFKVKVGTAAAVWAGGKVVEGIGSLTKAYKIAVKAGTLMALKKEKAEAWLPSLEKNSGKTERLMNRLGNIVKMLASQNYDFIELTKDDSKYSQKRSIMLDALGMYRKGIYSHLMILFFLSECNAWLSGNHDGTMEQPTLEDVNDIILNDTLFPLSIEERNNGLQESEDINNEINNYLADNAQISGRLLFLINDEQLMAWYLGTRENPTWLSEAKQKISERTKQLLEDNPAVKEADTLLDERYEIEGGKIFRQILPVINAILLIIIIIIMLNRLDDDIMEISTIWKIVIGVVLSAIVCWRTMVSMGKIELAYKPKLEKHNLYAQNTLLKMSGKQPQRLTITEQKKRATAIIFGAILGGIVGFLFIPIPGGLLIGAMIGAALLDSDKETQTESDGSDYKDVKTGNSWLSLILLMALGYAVWFLWFGSSESNEDSEVVKTEQTDSQTNVDSVPSQVQLNSNENNVTDILIQAQKRIKKDDIIEVCSDVGRHCLYYWSESDGIDCFDAITKKTQTLEMKDSHGEDVAIIYKQYKSPDGKYIFIESDGSYGIAYTLFRLDTYSRKVELIGEGDVIIKTDRGFTITSRLELLTPDSEPEDEYTYRDIYLDENGNKVDEKVYKGE